MLAGVWCTPQRRPGGWTTFGELSRPGDVGVASVLKGGILTAGFGAGNSGNAGTESCDNNQR